MIHCSGQRCRIEIPCQGADAVATRVSGEGFAMVCSMQRKIGHVWFALLILPLGTHTVRYTASFGRRTLFVGQESVAVTEAEVRNGSMIATNKDMT